MGALPHLFLIYLPCDEDMSIYIKNKIAVLGILSRDMGALSQIIIGILINNVKRV